MTPADPLDAARAPACLAWRRFAEPLAWDEANAPFAPARTHDHTPWANLDVAARAPPAAALVQQRCARAGLRLGREAVDEAPLRRMLWLHFPKAGTSFGTTLVHHGCPRIPPHAAADEGAPIVSLTSRYPRGRRRWCDANAFTGSLNGHTPLQRPCALGPSARPVALFREPAARQASECAAVDAEFRRTFGSRAAEPPTRRRRCAHRSRLCGQVDARSHREQGKWEWAPGSVYADPFLRTFLLSHGFSHAAIGALTAAWNARRAIRAADCARLPGWRGCQAKMLLGIPCAAPVQINASLGAAAVRLVRRLAFVGLTERFDDAVCLFHARFGGRPVPAQFLNVRPRVPRNGSESASRDEAALVAAVDPWEVAVYAAARERFEADLARAVTGNR